MRHYSISAAAREIGTHPTSLRHHIEAGHVFPPTAIPEGLKLPRYTPEEVASLKRWWASRVPYGVSRFSQQDIMSMKAEYDLGVPQGVIAEKWGTDQSHVSRLLSGFTQPGWRGGPTGLGKPKGVRTGGRRNRRSPPHDDGVIVIE